MTLREQVTEWQRIGKQIDAAFVFAGMDFISVHRVVALFSAVR